MTRKCQGLKRSQDFKQVYSRGRRLKGPHLTFFFIPNRLDHSRLGLTVAKKHFKLSVRRHYIQRRLREAVRLNKDRFLPGYDIVLSAQRFEKEKITLSEVQEEILSLAHKVGLLKKDEIV